MEKWELISSEMAFDERWYKVRKDTVKLPNGRVLDDYYLGVRGRYVQMLPVFDNGDILMVKQYKHGVGDITLELPAGMVEEGEDVDKCAARELKEETGYTGKKWSRLTVTNENPSKSINQSYWYLVQELELSEGQHLDDNEQIEVVRLPYAEVVKKIQTGEIIAGPSIGQILLGLYEIRRLALV